MDRDTLEVLGTVLVLGLLLFTPVAFAIAEPLGAPLPGCVPAYLTLDPDVRQVESYQFLAVIYEKDRRVRWQHEFVFPDRSCCQLTRNALVDVTRLLRDPSALVVIGECR